MNQSSKILLMAFFCLSTISIAQAQRGRSMDPVKMADRQTSLMADSLALSDAQKEKIAEVNLLYAKKMTAARMEARENPDSDRSTMRTMMQTMRTEQKAEIQKYLTAEQFEKWGKMETTQRKGRRGGEGRSGKKSRNRKNKEQKQTSPDN